MSLNHASPRALPVLYNCSFLFWDRATLVCISMHLLSNDPWFSAGRTNSTQVKEFFPVLVMSSSAVIVNMSWRGQEELLQLSIHNLTWQESNIGRIINHNISIQSKIVQELFETCNWFAVWLRMTSEFFHLLSHLLRLEKGCSESLFFIEPFKPSPKSDQRQISPCNSDAL